MPLHNEQQKQLVSDALQIDKLEVTSHKQANSVYNR